VLTECAPKKDDESIPALLSKGETFNTCNSDGEAEPKPYESEYEQEEQSGQQE